MKTSSEKPGVVVLGAESQGLGIIRLLAEHSVPVFVVDQDALGIAQFSRYCKRFAQSPPYTRNGEFIRFLCDICTKHSLRDWTLFSTDDEQVRVIAQNRDELSRFYRICTPEWAIISKLYRKDLFYEYAEELGLPIPKTWRISSLDDVGSLDLAFPLIIKPTIKRDFYAHFRKKAIEVQDPSQLVTVLKKVLQVAPFSDLLLQEVVPGSGSNQYSYVALFSQGSPSTELTARRTRQHPMDYGHASTFVEAVDYPLLKEISVQLLRSLDYYGVCEVEFKLDPRDNVPKLLEVNPRFWGWHTLARKCGANYPYMLYCDIYGFRMPEFGSNHVGARWVKTITDLPVVLGEIWRGNLSLPALFREYSGAVENATFVRHDPLPFVAEWFLIPYLWFKRGY
jgi:D-aspartate ligase